MKNIVERLKHWARQIKQQVMTLWFCYRHPLTPRLPKCVAILVVGYALSPIDLIPDFIPVLGYLDDVILVPLGIMLAIRLMPPQVLADGRQQAIEWQASQQRRPVNRVAAVVVVLIWIALAVAVGYWFLINWFLIS
jgi:uncharacterized membrane protein YkvA (DUF1232 family)